MSEEQSQIRRLDKDVLLITAVIWAANCEDDTLLRGLNDELLDHYLGLPRGNWPEKLDAQSKTDLKGVLTILQSPEAQPAKVGPSLPLSRYAGSYNDPWFGTIKIRQANEKLAVEFPHWPGITAELEHWQYDSFRVRFNDRSVEPAYMTFQLGPDGMVDRVTMRPVSPLADPSFDYQDLLFTPVTAAAGN